LPGIRTRHERAETLREIGAVRLWVGSYYALFRTLLSNKKITTNPAFVDP
jgi:hypothetical protein